MVLIEFAWRDRGLVVSSGSEEKIQDIKRLKGQRVVVYRIEHPHYPTG
jgi:molybdate-binding protein